MWWDNHLLSLSCSQINDDNKKDQAALWEESESILCLCIIFRDSSEKQVITTIFKKNQKQVWMAVVNKVHKQVRMLLSGRERGQSDKIMVCIIIYIWLDNVQYYRSIWPGTAYPPHITCSSTGKLWTTSRTELGWHCHHCCTL